MIEPLFVLPVELVLVDRGINSVSLINVIEEVHPAGFPLLIPRLTIYALTSREAGDPPTARGHASIFLDDEEVFSDDQELDFGESMLNRSLLQFQGFVLPRAGVLTFHYRVGEREVRSYPVPATPMTDAPRLEQVRTDRE